MKETSEHTKNRAKTEKDSRRTLELRLTALEEEISDLKIEKGNLEKVNVRHRSRTTNGVLYQMYQFPEILSVGT